MWFRRKKEEQRLHTITDTSGNNSLLFDDLSRSNAMSIPGVYSAINLISNAVASTKIENAPALLNREPQENITKYVWLNTVVKNILLHGNAYALIEEKELVLLDPKALSAFYDKNSQKIVYYQYFGTKAYPEDILHFKNTTKDNLGQIGISSLVNFANNFSKVHAMNDFQGNFMINASRPEFWLEHPGRLKKETIMEMAEGFKKIAAGIKNVAKVPVLSEGIQLKELKPRSIVDSDLVKLKEATLKEIAMMFNIPVSMLDNSLSNYGNAVEANLSFLKMTINPLLTNIKEEINLKLNSNMTFDTSSLIEGSFEQKIKTLTSAVAGGILTPNEARARLNYPELKAGNKLFNPAGTPGETENKINENKKEGIPDAV